MVQIYETSLVGALTCHVHRFRNALGPPVDEVMIIRTYSAVTQGPLDVLESHIENGLVLAFRDDL